MAGMCRHKRLPQMSFKRTLLVWRMRFAVRSILSCFVRHMYSTVRLLFSSSSSLEFFFILCVLLENKRHSVNTRWSLCFLNYDLYLMISVDSLFNTHFGIHINKTNSMQQHKWHHYSHSTERNGKFPAKFSVFINRKWNQLWNVIKNYKTTFYFSVQFACTLKAIKTHAWVWHISIKVKKRKTVLERRRKMVVKKFVKCAKRANTEQLHCVKCCLSLPFHGFKCHFLWSCNFDSIAPGHARVHSHTKTASHSNCW